MAIASEIALQYASANGLQFEQRSQLDSAAMPPSLVKLVVMAPDPGVAALAPAAPQAQIITVGFSTDASGTNLINLSLGGPSGSEAAFIAGYIAALSAEDWRSGILYTSEDASDVNDFEAGFKYFCGSCVPVSPPYNVYPASAQIADVQNWQSAADQLLAQSVKVVYLAQGLETSGAAQYFANSGVLLIGQGTPPAELSGSWIVSIGSDPAVALRQLLPLALDGQPLDPLNSLSLSNANMSLFSESRQNYVRQVINDLSTGHIQLPADQ